MKDKMDESKGSPYPYLRLILPDHDSARPHSGLKESKIAETWAKALGQTKGSKIYSLLTGYRNGKLIKNQDSIGDLSCVVKAVKSGPNSSKKLKGDMYAALVEKLISKNMSVSSTYFVYPDYIHLA